MKTSPFLFILFIHCFVISCSAQEVDSPITSLEEINIAEVQLPPMMLDENSGSVSEHYNFINDIELHKIAYESDGFTVTGWIAKPKGEGPFPAVIWNRGGNQDFGALDKAFMPLAFLGRIAKEGYYVIASNYRGNAGGTGREEFGGADVNDVVRLIDIIDTDPSADGERIGMHGWSRGGIMTYRALTMTDRIKAVVVGGSPSDKFEGLKDRPGFESLFEELIPNYLENREEEIKKRSVLYWVDELPKDIPYLILHGTADWRVKPEQSLRLAMKFDEYRLPYRLIMFEGADHGIREHRSEVHEQTMDWFDRFVKNDESLPDMEFHGK